MKRLSGKIALITGGTSGMGAATAKLFQAEGARVIVTGNSPEGLDAARRAMPEVEVIQSNAGDPAAARSLIEQVAQKYGRIDVLFVNAGISRLASIDSVEESLFDEIFNVNFRGPYFLLKHAVPVLADGGSIILTSSTAAVLGMPGVSAYGASKGALRSLGIHLAVELAPRCIRVNTITPGPIQTSIGAKMGLTQEQMEWFGQMIAKLPLARIGQPEEIAAAALYFASDDSRFTTGTELRVDGGMTLV